MLWSGGKDSTASVILCHELGIKTDEIIMSEVMYCNKRQISGEHPEHMKFVREVAIPKFESWGYKVTVLRGEVDFLTHFYHIIETPKKHHENKGKHFGFPCGKMCAIRRDCKMKPISEYLKNAEGNVTEICGIAADEEKRLLSMQNRKQRSVMAECGYTENMACELCSDYGLLSPTYGLSKRGGCWFCPFARMDEHSCMKQNNPKIWEEFVALEEVDNVANPRWNIFKEPLRERDMLLENYY